MPDLFELVAGQSSAGHVPLILREHAGSTPGLDRAIFSKLWANWTLVPPVRGGRTVLPKGTALGLVGLCGDTMKQWFRTLEAAE